MSEISAYKIQVSIQMIIKKIFFKCEKCCWLSTEQFIHLSRAYVKLKSIFFSSSSLFILLIFLRFISDTGNLLISLQMSRAPKSSKNIFIVAIHIFWRIEYDHSQMMSRFTIIILFLVTHTTSGLYLGGSFDTRKGVAGQGMIFGSNPLPIWNFLNFLDFFWKN